MTTTERRVQIVWPRIPPGFFRTVALVYWSVATQLIPVWFPANQPAVAIQIYTTIGILLTAIGLGRAWANKAADNKEKVAIQNEEAKGGL